MKTIIMTKDGTYEAKYDYIDLFNNLHIVSSEGDDILASEIIFSYDELLLF
jgi:hypothetical protein